MGERYPGRLTFSDKRVVADWLEQHVEAFEDGTCVYRDPTWTDRVAATKAAAALGLTITQGTVAGLRAECWGFIRKRTAARATPDDLVAIMDLISKLEQRVAHLEQAPVVRINDNSGRGSL